MLISFFIKIYSSYNLIFSIVLDIFQWETKAENIKLTFNAMKKTTFSMEKLPS